MAASLEAAWVHESDSVPHSVWGGFYEVNGAADPERAPDILMTVITVFSKG